ncbi:hypothetical protein BO71DRAFT_403015 [Aspergillus ellipticus CBS 707.79]|uniref:Uncharacterized protein n=1 Tax=Aspergillus ellipticus CBS 707.79 TaxID=1448320 RepID=A0A319DN38_9EURO|nr:hypothetical protein BO71DRAFT_403015 [Aspergillus ellipticus CBS 707.79]
MGSKRLASFILPITSFPTIMYPQMMKVHEVDPFRYVFIAGSCLGNGIALPFSTFLSMFEKLYH